MDNSYFCWLKILSVCVIGFTLHVEGEHKCLQKLDGQGLGYTYPPGDIYIEYNTSQPLEITCVLTDEKYISTHPNASSALRFKRSKDVVPSDQIQILNDTSIKLRINNPELSSTMYGCQLNGLAVCLNNVVIGRKPECVNDFKCIGHNYDNLTCSWTPDENYSYTNYSLTYTLPPTRSGGRPNKCPGIKGPTKDDSKMSCFWSVKTVPFYRQSHSFFTFELRIENIFGHKMCYYNFSHFKNILSGPPEELRCFNATTHSLGLTWNIPVSMAPFENGLEHRILYQNNFEPNQWKFGGIIETRGGLVDPPTVFYNLTGLPYAHGLYDIRVAIRVRGAEVEEMWSRNSTLTEWTESTIPGAAPKTNMGSFEIVTSVEKIESREVYVYWQQLPSDLKNGQNFTYHVKVNNDTGVNATRVELVKLTNAYAKFKNLMLYQNYTFFVWAKNAEGLSREKSVVFVPSLLDRVEEPSSFRKIAYSNGVYELSWDRSKRNDYSASNLVLTNYTLFWCSHNRERPYQCTGMLNWTVVSANISVYNITVPDDGTETIQFAISANGLSASSGMVWADCTIIHNQPVKKMKDVWIMKVGTNYIDVGWKLDCADRLGTIKGFVINYCPMKSPHQKVCNGNLSRNVTIDGDASVTHGRVDGLTPYVSYMLMVSVKYNADTYTSPSDPLYNTTFEAAPSVPLNLEVTEITNSSVSLTWNPPEYRNGVLRKYEIFNDNRLIHTIDIQDKLEKSEEPFTFTLTNLTSYKLHNFSVAACTNTCSERSQPISVQTKIGYPSEIGAPKVSFQNNSYIVIKWDEPFQPRGRNDVYEVLFKEKLDGENKTLPIFNVTETQYGLESCGNEGSYNTFYISVRAVNVDKGTHYEGPWSQELEAYCQPGGVMYWVFIVVICAGILVLVFLGRRLYCTCKNMSNVDIKLPDGLDPKNTENRWNNQKGPTEIIHRPPADEELLLDKMGEGRRSGDSSGCSSGQGSVTPSLESGSSLTSSSDSGTEQPRTPTGEESKTSVRLRNVSSAKPTGNKVDNPSPTLWSPSNTSPGNYCVLGVDPNSPTETESTYVSSKSQSDTTSLPYVTYEPSAKSPYVLTGELNKTPANTGYVPITTDLERNPAYVMAGNKSVLLTDLVQQNPTQIADDKPMYVQVADVNGGLKGVPDVQATSPPKQETLLNKVGGYVSFGEVPTPRVAIDATNKSYVPHRRFEAKSQKED